jgi:hypothetical protein
MGRACRKNRRGEECIGKDTTMKPKTQVGE